MLPVRTYGYSDGNLTTATKPSGATLTFAYDEQDRVTAEGGEAGHVQLTLEYSEPDPRTGNRTTILHTADGRSTRHLVDDRCRALATIDPLGNTTRETFDVHGNRLSHTDALGHTTTFSYSAQGRLTAVTQADGTQFHITRHESGLPTEIMEPGGSRRMQEFDHHGNRTTVTEPGGSSTCYAYDAAGRITSVTDTLGSVTSIRCTPAGLPQEITDPLGDTTRYPWRSIFAMTLQMKGTTRIAPVIREPTPTTDRTTPIGNLAARYG
ncbi:hypothetical protein ACIFUY_19725 [Streptomyces sp. CACIS-1.16CA]|uniref:hypothetical protein n=1 Tax=Streptomyces sp. CACIS-1.16CA TaxID=1175510 RepID=UPI0037CDEFCE